MNDHSVEATTSQTGASKRDAILEAALSLFAEKGFHGTAVPLLAERAGVGTGTIYRYFASKEALVNELYQHHKMAFVMAVLADFPVDAPVRKQFHELFQRLYRWVADNPDAFFFLELHHHGPYLDEDSRALEERVMARTEDFYQLAREQEALKEAPAPVLVAVVWGIFVGVMKASRDGHLELTPEAKEQVEACAWEAIRR